MAATVAPTSSPQYWPLHSTHVLVAFLIIASLSLLSVFDWLSGSTLISGEYLAATWIVVAPTCGYFISTISLSPATIVESTTKPAPLESTVTPATSMLYWPLSATHVLLTTVFVLGLLILTVMDYLSGSKMLTGEFLAAVYIILLPTVSWFVSNIAITPTSIAETTSAP